MKKMKTIKLNDSGILFDAESHTYCTKDGEVLHGITGRLKERAFPEEYKDVSEDVLQRAAMRGTRIHHVLELYDKVGIETDDCMELQNYMKAQTEFPFLANHLQSEYLITDGEKYASAIDKIFIEDDGVIIGDVKTTYHLNEEYVSWQLSIYAYFFNLINPDIEVKKLYALWFREDKYKVVEVERKSIEDVKKLLYTEEALPVTTVDEEMMPDINRAEAALIEYKEAMEFYKAQYDKLKEGILAIMMQHDIKKYDGQRISITRKPETERLCFDSKAFKNDYPQMYEQYITKTKTSSSILIKVK